MSNPECRFCGLKHRAVNDGWIYDCISALGDELEKIRKVFQLAEHDAYLYGKAFIQVEQMASGKKLYTLLDPKEVRLSYKEKTDAPVL